MAGDANDDPPVAAVDFTAKIIITNHPGFMRVGYAPVLHCHTAHIVCQFKEIVAKLDRLTGEVVKENPDFVKKGDACMVTLKPTKPLCVETFAEYPSLGRFVMRDMHKTVTFGVVMAVNKTGHEAEVEPMGGKSARKK